MSRWNPILSAALSALSYSGADRLAHPLTGGAGAIFMLHHVRPDPPEGFEPNRILKITPGFLETVVRHTLAAGYEPISLDELPDRLRRAEKSRPFACFTFDDGYRDNRDYALPILRRYGVPCTIYVPSAFADGRGDLWWLTLEAAIRQADEVCVTMHGAARRFSAVSPAAKDRAFHEIYWWLRSEPEDEARSVVADIARQASFDSSGLCKSLVMSWEELRELARDPLVTIGAHTCGHYALAKLPIERARAEMCEGRARIEAELGRPCRHFSFPYGDAGSAGDREFELVRQLGFLTAVTTRKGLLHGHHAGALTALPRLSLNGDFQDERCLAALISGLPFAMLEVAEKLKRGLRPQAAGPRPEPASAG